MAAAWRLLSISLAMLLAPCAYSCSCKSAQSARASSVGPIAAVASSSLGEMAHGALPVRAGQVPGAPPAASAPISGEPPDTIEIPGGSFAMGSDDQGASDNERPVHRIAVASFRLDRTEVTVGAYAACVGGGVCSEPDAYRHEKGTRHIFCNWKHPEGRSTHPINCVDHQQATTYCSWRGQRLPTEVEWEYAARGEEGRRYPWGDEPPDPTRLNACGTECPGNAVAKGLTGWPPMYPASDGWPETAPVGNYPAGASKHGVLDLAGNVWEWTASEYERYDGQVDEKIPRWKRVLRGGSWGGSDVRTERTTNRFALDPSSRAQFLGFRCASGR